MKKSVAALLFLLLFFFCAPVLGGCAPKRRVLLTG